MNYYYIFIGSIVAVFALHYLNKYQQAVDLRKNLKRNMRVRFKYYGKMLVGVVYSIKDDEIFVESAGYKYLVMRSEIYPL